MEHQTPSGFPGNFRKRKVLGALWFPSGLPETLGKANPQGAQKKKVKKWATPIALRVESRDIEIVTRREGRWG